MGIIIVLKFIEDYIILAINFGTAVNIQAMVFGNMGDNCGTGVSFSRNPVTGRGLNFFGEY